MESIEIGNVKISAWDLGGHKAVRDIWQDYYTKADAVIYLVDLFDEDRIEESCEEFWAMLKEDIMKDCVVLVMGNKCDRPKTIDIEEIRKYFRLDEAKENVKAIELFKVSLYNGHGYQESLKWLEEKLM